MTPAQRLCLMTLMLSLWTGSVFAGCGNNCDCPNKNSCINQSSCCWNSKTDRCLKSARTGASGSCDLCKLGTGVTCAASDDCHAVGTCAPASGVCSNPSKPCCSDGIMNGDETGTDCGGSCTTKCPQAPQAEDKCTSVPDDSCGFDVYGADCSAYLTATSKEECCRLCVNNDDTTGVCSGLCHGFSFDGTGCTLWYESQDADACRITDPNSIDWPKCTHECV